MIIEQELTYEQFLNEPEREYLNGYNSREQIVLQYRENNQKYALKIKKFPWYFCVTVEDFNKHKAFFTKMQEMQLVKSTEQDGDFMKLYCRNTDKKVMDEKHQLIVELDEKGIKHYESDVSSVQRLLVDQKLEIAKDYRVLYFDIETDDRGRGIVVGRDEILSIACVDKDEVVKYFTHKFDPADTKKAGERRMLTKFIEYIDDYDLLAGWNSEKFDIPYIQERLKYHDIYYDSRQILKLDMMQKTMEVHKRNIELIKEVRGFSLNAISKYFLKEEKVVHSMGIYEMYEKDPVSLKKYNIQDVMLLLKLDRKLKLIDQKIAEHQITGCFLCEYAVSRILDVYVLRNAKKFGSVRFPSKPNRDTLDFSSNREAGYVGGYVIEPITGLHHNIYHFDFTSLYPSIIQTFNISPETWIRKREEGEKSKDVLYTPNGQVFAKEKGIIPKIIGDLLKARNDVRNFELKKYKEGTQEYEQLYFKQYAFKTIANSFYGILGAPFTRYYKLETAESITLSGHYLIKTSKKFLEEKGYKVIYGDTDSVFVQTEQTIDQDALHREINEFLSYHLFRLFNVVDSHIDLKVEDHYDSMLLTDKKKYVKQKGDELKIVGLEARRRETLPFAAQAQKDMLKMLMVDKADVKTIKSWLDSLKDYVMNHMKKEELMLQVKLSKDCEDYDKKIYDEEGNLVGVKESKLPHIKVAKWLIENSIKENGMNTWERGCYIKFIVIEHKPKVDAVSIYNYEDNYDHAYYWNVKVYAILDRVLKVIAPEENWDSFLIEVPKKQRISKKQTKMNI